VSLTDLSNINTTLFAHLNKLFGLWRGGAAHLSRKNVT